MNRDRAGSPWKLVAWTVGAWWASHIVLIAGHVAYIFLYSIAIAPGLGSESYTAHAHASGPWYSILLGGPVFFWIGRFFRRRLSSYARRLGFAVWALYSATDLAIVLVAGAAWTPLFTAQWITSQAIKGLAIWLATRPARVARSDR